MTFAIRSLNDEFDNWILLKNSTGKNRINIALKHIDENRLIIAPDCGLGLLSAEIAEEKLKVMCKAASNYCL